MPRRKERIDLYKARALNWQQHYECRQYLLSLPKEVQERYQSLSMAFPEWNLNNFGAIEMSDDMENRLIYTANQYGLQAWYLISFYTSEDGWNRFLGKFNELPAEETFRNLYYVQDILGKLSTGYVDKTSDLSTYPQVEQ